jgi:TRAP-type C4-dicarboxylate transport system substrate-binding protein
MKGLKIRTMENPVHLAAFRTLGALPTPMSWTEVLSALQQGTVDGQENPMSILISTKLWESQRYVTLSNHAFTPVAFIVSPALFDSLSAEDQEILREAAKAGSAANRRYVDEMEAKGIEELKKHGMEVVTDLDTAEFEAAMEPIYEKYASQFGDLVDRIRSEAQD